MVMQRVKNGDTVQRKLNGDRAVMVAQDSRISLFNRHGENFRHPVVNTSLFSQFGLTVLDGEVWRSKFWPFEAIVWKGQSLIERGPAEREAMAYHACGLVNLPWIYALDRNWLYGELRQEHSLSSQWEGVVIKQKDSPYRVLGTDTQDSETWTKWKFEVVRR
jgi:ATP-dependent DNA ligase